MRPVPCLLLALCLMAAAPRRAPAQGHFGPAAGFHQHDGLYLRLFAGPGYARYRLDDEERLTVVGARATVGFALGAVVAENLVLYGELLRDAVVDPSATIYGSSDVSTGDELTSVGLGAGVAYYVMPLDLYVSGTLAATRMTVKDDGRKVLGTEFGPTISLMVGKEWWVSPDWGLGVAGQVLAGRMKDDGVDQTWAARAFAVVFSATFN